MRLPTEKAIIVDLDNTIFETRTMDKKVFEPFFYHLSSNLKTYFNSFVIENILDDLWSKTWDSVITEYRIPVKAYSDSITFLNELELNLNIIPYPDYIFMKQIQCPKFLVTTSLTSLQEKKIAALKIENDFTKIIINDTFKRSETKQDIFKNLMKEFELVPEKTYVIGDNNDSEIKAGNALNMVTIQMLRPGVIKGDQAKYYIESFYDLETILK